jgi:hypothetical protein
MTIEKRIYKCPCGCEELRVNGRIVDTLLCNLHFEEFKKRLIEQASEANFNAYHINRSKLLEFSDSEIDAIIKVVWFSPIFTSLRNQIYEKGCKMLCDLESKNE